MIIADRLKNTNRAEYLLYMWQVEDLIRAFQFNSERLAKDYVSQFQLTPEQRAQTEKWYDNICNMMISEGVKEKGHTQICKNILQQLVELNHQLLESQKFPYYKQMYFKVLPYIVELRQKFGGSEQQGELETCFDTLYGVMMLRLQHKPISEGTTQAAHDISAFLGQLSDYYFADKKEPIEF